MNQRRFFSLHVTRVGCVEAELATVGRLLEQCEQERDTEVLRRQQTDERLRQALQAERLLTTQLQSRSDSTAAQLQVIVNNRLIAPFARIYSAQIGEFFCSEFCKFLPKYC